MSATDVFSDVYERDLWNGGSGPGSAPENSEVYRRFLQEFLDGFDYPVKVVDLGCGDWRIGELMDWLGVDYVGVDVVPEVVEANRRRDTPDNVSFVCLDALVDDLPEGDVLVVKDVLQHWPNADVLRLLDAAEERFTFTVVTNDVSSKSHPAKVNSDIALGDWRPVDIERAPFDRVAIDHVDYPVLGEWVKRVVVI